MKIGILREGKTPPDKRVVLSPKQCTQFIQQYPDIDLVVQPSSIRCFSDDQYLSLGINMQEDLSDCDILMGVKEVAINDLIPEKTYLYFSHTIKKQHYNRQLLKRMLELNIRMVDYEVLTDVNGKRIIGFGRYAGIIGCYNGFLAIGKRTKTYDLKPAYMCKDRKEMELELKKIILPKMKIIVTGAGRVGNGVIELINLIGIKQVSKDEFLNKNFDQSVFVHLNTIDYNRRIDGKEGSESDFFSNPKSYKSDFMKFAKQAEFFIAGHYHAADSPFLFTRDDAKSKDFKIKTVADISCDIDGPVASTIRCSSITKPIYGYNPDTETEDDYRKQDVITVMAVDNLPCELPKDASISFGQNLLEHVIPNLIGDDLNNLIERATICENGRLKNSYRYLESYVMNDDDFLIT
tara:strand:- start:246 stop:1466 length:1221 start_codon:yes stop_codon:yes gene_type:complete